MREGRERYDRRSQDRLDTVGEREDERRKRRDEEERRRRKEEEDRVQGLGSRQCLSPLLGFTSSPVSLCSP